MNKRLHGLNDHKILENAPHKWVAANLLWGTDAKQMTKETGFYEVVFWRFDHTLAKVLEMRSQLEDNERSFQN